MTPSLRHLRLADLELFITAAHMKNLSKAAVLHHLSQSAASAAIQRVELAFGRPLCLHEKRQFRLTHAGTTLIPRAEEWLKQFRETVAADIPRPIRLATTQAIARVIVPALIAIESIELHLLRPDLSYGAVLRDEADLALVPDNAVWDDVTSVDVGVGVFQLYATNAACPMGPILLPENQIEVLKFIQRWEKRYHTPPAIKARIPSWSLIADICAKSQDVGFLPEFLAKKVGLYPVSWQPAPSPYRLLALYRSSDDTFQRRLNILIDQCQAVFATPETPSLV